MLKRINKISAKLEAAVEIVSSLTKVLEIALKNELIKASEREADLLIESIKKSQEIERLQRQIRSDNVKK